MPYRGHIENGVVKPDGMFPWPDGTKVIVDASADVPDDAIGDGQQTLYERLEPLIGKAEGLPADLAENHDHYLHGRPKK